VEGPEEEGFWSDTERALKKWAERSARQLDELISSTYWATRQKKAPGDGRWTVDPPGLSLGRYVGRPHVCVKQLYMSRKHVKFSVKSLHVRQLQETRAHGLGPTDAL